jgi:hypothetical protein
MIYNELEHYGQPIGVVDEDYWKKGIVRLEIWKTMLSYAYIESEGMIKLPRTICFATRAPQSCIDRHEGYVQLFEDIVEQGVVHDRR